MNTRIKACVLLLFALKFVFCLAAGKNPMSNAFVENKGQLRNQNKEPNHEVLYLYTGNEMKVQIRQLGFSYEYVDFHCEAPKNEVNKSRFLSHNRPKRVDIQRVDIEFIGANTDGEIFAYDTLSWYKNYKNENTPDLGINGVRIYRTIRINNLYQGIDLQYNILDDGQFKYDFIIHPGGDLNIIRWKYLGADSVTYSPDQIQLHICKKVVNETIPSSYILETSNPVNVKYMQAGLNEFGFESSEPMQGTLIVDPSPQLVWCTYFGGSWDHTSGFETGIKDGFYFTGITSTDNLATSGVYRDTLWDHPDYPWDTYIVKMNNSGTSILWCTYYGGNTIDDVVAIKVDGNGDIVISGYTDSDTGLSTAGAYMSSSPSSMLGKYHGFLAKFNDSGKIKWSTYLGGTESDLCTSLDLDEKNNIYVSGWTTSDGLATPGVYQDTNSGGGDCFLCKVTPSGHLTWFTYYGGTDGESSLGTGLTVRNSSIYITGGTGSKTNIATSGTYQTIIRGWSDGFLAKFDTTGNIIWGTYLGGNKGDFFRHVVCDGLGNIYVAGITNSDSFISYGNVHADTLSGSYDLIAASFTAAGAIRWSSYFGGFQDEWLGNASINSCGELLLVGYTYSENGIATAKAYDTLHGSSGVYADGFLVQFNDSGKINYGTYLGFSDDAELLAVTYDAHGHFLVGGGTYTDSMATVGAYQTAVRGYNAVILMFDSVSMCPIVVLSANFIDTKASRIPNEKALITWNYTTSEDEPTAFEIFRRTAHRDFVKVGTVTAFANKESYRFTDDLSGAGNMVSYRIKYLGRNEKKPIWSQIVSLPDVFSEQVNLFPNPASHGFDLIVPEALEVLSVQLLDMAGRVIVSMPVAPGLLHINTEKLTDGIYWIRLITAAENRVFKLQIRQM